MAKGFLSATKFTVEINRAQLLKSITYQQATALGIRKELEPNIDRIQDKLIKDFNSHAVTLELKNGASTTNISNTLGGYGNLFSFIGFDSGEDPTSVIEELLSQKMTFKVRAIASGRFKITIFVPSKDEIFSMTPLPWASGASWAEGIEKGISNLGSYLYSSSGFKESNSGTGVQIKNSKKSVTFKTTPYISGIFKKFQRSLENLGK